MKKEHIIERDGKSFVLFAGVLDLAHEQAAGRLHIHTQLLQVPGPENGHVAICFAEAKMVDEGGVVYRSCTGIGDADPSNVSKRMASALIRMAETRSKARALRDLTNVAAAVDETDEGADPRQPDGPPADREREAPQSLRDRYEALQREARRLGVESGPELALDAPDDFVIGLGRALRQRIDAGREHGHVAVGGRS